MTKLSLKTLSIALLVASSNALAPSNSNSNSKASSTSTSQRRQFLTGLAGAGVAFLATSPQAQAAAAKTGASSPWTGEYNDPGHPNCLRSVKVVGAPIKMDGTRSPYPIVEIKGYDGPDGAKMCTERPPSRDVIWTVKGELRGNQASLDFSSKGGPSKLLAKYEDGGIVFPDGNKWAKIPMGTPERFPKDMRTLKSED